MSFPRKISKTDIWVRLVVVTAAAVLYYIH